MPFSGILGQSRAIVVLAAALRADRVPHAYLFEGLDGVGRRAAALALAQGLNCLARADTGKRSPGSAGAERGGAGAMRGASELESGSELAPERAPADDACGACRPCRKIAAGDHPDVQILAPEGQSGGGVYLVDQIRTLARNLAFRPFEGRRKVAVLERAEALGPVAGNALLKTLEEPPASSHLVLLAPGRHHLLPTVASRCQAVTFRPLETADLVRILETRGLPAAPDGGWDHAGAAQAAALADGSAGRAVALAAAGGLEGRRALIDQVTRLSRRRVDELFRVAERLAADKDALPGHIETLRGWLRDLLVARAAVEGEAPAGHAGEPRFAVPLLCGDLAEAVAAQAADRRFEELAAGLAAIDAARAALRRNANRTLVVEQLLLKLAQP